MGRTDDAERAMKECMAMFDRRTEPKDTLSETDEEQDATGDIAVLQRIGVTLREKKEFDKASDILERVLAARKKLYLKENNLNDGGDIDYSGKDFAKLYGDLALTYQGMDDLEYSQEYLVLAI